METSIWMVNDGDMDHKVDDMDSDMIINWYKMDKMNDKMNDCDDCGSSGDGDNMWIWMILWM